jgi:hypothetical protein
MTAEEVQKKLGKEIATRYAWLNHSCFYGCKEIGTTSFKNKIQVNQDFLGADLKITLSGIKVHYDAGYGGGADIVVSNAYPLNAPASVSQRWIGLSPKQGGTGFGGMGQGSGMIVYSQYMDRNLMNNYPPSTTFATKWEEVITVLKERHRGTSIQVAVHPYAGMQHQEIELDG